jgi:ligand-binding SRPBCC domain-containing protein
MSRRFQSEQWVAAPLDRVFAFFADPHNLPRIMPPGLGTKLVKLNLVPPRFSAGQVPQGTLRMAGTGTEITVAFRVIPYLPVHERWIVNITEFQLNSGFHDVQTQGPFRRWEHTHSFEAMMQDGREGTLIRDEVEYEVGFGIVGRTLEAALFQHMFRSTFNYRKRVVGQIFAFEGATASRAVS